MTLTATPERAVAEGNTILRALVGSGVHGTNIGTSDRDEMGVCCEPAEYVIGLSQFEQAVIRDKPQGVRSGPGDTDCTIYSLRKWCRLTLGGNPSAMILLFVPRWAMVTTSALGKELQDLAWAFASRRAGAAFLGYMQQQRQRLVGERGQLRVTRQELVAAHGFDTKYAGHMLRLGYQGIEYMATGVFTLPMPEVARQRVLAVRRGQVTLPEVLGEAAELEANLQTLMDTSPLPAEPHRDAVNDWLIDAYRRHWAANVH